MDFPFIFENKNVQTHIFLGNIKKWTHEVHKSYLHHNKERNNVLDGTWVWNEIAAINEL